MRSLSTLLIVTFLTAPVLAGEWKEEGRFHEAVQLRVETTEDGSPQLHFRHRRWGDVQLRDNESARFLLEHVDFLTGEKLRVSLKGKLWRLARLDTRKADEQRALMIEEITDPAWTVRPGFVLEDAARPGKLGLTDIPDRNPAWLPLEGPLVELLRVARGRRVWLRGWQVERWNEPARFVPLQVRLAGREGDHNWDLEYSVSRNTFVLDGAAVSLAYLQRAIEAQTVEIWKRDPVHDRTRRSKRSRRTVTATLRTFHGSVVWDAKLIEGSSSLPLALQVEKRTAPLTLVYQRRLYDRQDPYGREARTSTPFPHLHLFESRQVTVTGLHVTARKDGIVEREQIVVESVEPRGETISGQVVTTRDGVSLRLQSGEELPLQDWLKRGGPPVRSRLSTLLRPQTRVTLEGYRFSDHFLLMRIRASYRFHPDEPALWISHVSERDGVAGVEVSSRRYPQSQATTWHGLNDLRWEEEPRRGLTNLGR